MRQIHPRNDSGKIHPRVQTVDSEGSISPGDLEDSGDLKDSVDLEDSEVVEDFGDQEDSEDSGDVEDSGDLGGSGFGLHLERD